jgi:hypothetical protein
MPSQSQLPRVARFGTAPVGVDAASPPRAFQVTRTLKAARPTYLLALAGTALLIVALIVELKGVGDHRWRLGLDAKGIESLAVLPLENLSRDPEQEYFSDGMMDLLITDLWRKVAVF